MKSLNHRFYRELRRWNHPFFLFQMSNKYGVPVTYLQEYKPLGTGQIFVNSCPENGICQT